MGAFMRSFLIAALLASTSALGAMAADVTEQAPYTDVPVGFSWTGAYLGVNAGYSFYDTTQSYPGAPLFVGHPEPDAFTLGAHAGYRYQFGNNIVAGIEADVYASLGSTAHAPLLVVANASRMDVNWGGSVRGQLGYAIDRFLPYVTGGLAFIDYEGGTTAALGQPVFPGTGYSKTTLGWTVGVGAAYAVTDNVVLNLEYRYSDYGKETFSTPGANGGLTSVDLKDHAIKMGISFKF